MSIVEPLPMGFGGSTSRHRPNPKKPVRPQRRQDYFYPSRDGQPLVKVTRVDRGTGSKFFVQYHWDGHQWVKGLTPAVRAQVPIYRYQEVRRAMAAGQAIWMVEGESCADALWNIGIPATTTLGGSKKYRSYGDYFKRLAGGSPGAVPRPGPDGGWPIWRILPRTFRLLSGATPTPRVWPGRTYRSMGDWMWPTGLPVGLRPIRFGQRWENDES